MNVEAPTLSRQFRLEESTLTMADVSLMIQSGYKPKKEWIQHHFKVDLADEEDFQAAAPEVEGAPETYDPEADGDLYAKIFGDEGEEAPETEMAPGEESGEEKPFGDEEITEDEAVTMADDKKG